MAEAIITPGTSLPGKAIGRSTAPVATMQALATMRHSRCRT